MTGRRKKVAAAKQSTAPGRARRREATAQAANRLRVSRRTKLAVLKRLNPGEASDVLHRLLAARPDLRGTAEAIARALLRDVTCEGVAEEIEDGIRLLGTQDLVGRAGRHEFGYIDPSEAAWEVLQEAVDPALEDMRRLAALGMETEALETCKGIVLGLYRVRKETDDGLLAWVPDFPAEAAADAVIAWRACRARGRASNRRARTPSPLPADFVDAFVPEWREVIGRANER